MSDSLPPPTLEQLAAEMATLRRRMQDLEKATGLFATVRELDGPGGDPVVRFSPRAWRGPDFVGKKLSECSPEFLDVLAQALRQMADAPAEGKERYVAGNRKLAALARSWARRIRSRGTPAAEPEAKKGERPRSAGRPRRERASGGEPQPDEDDFLST